MLIFYKHRLYVCSWCRNNREDLKYQTVTELPAVVKQHEIIYVSDHSLSNIQHHLTNKVNPNYTPLTPIFEIYPDGSAFRVAAESVTSGANFLKRHAFDTSALTVTGAGYQAFITSLELCNGDVERALSNTQEVTPYLKEGLTVSVYDLPTPNVLLLNPIDTFQLGYPHEKETQAKPQAS